MITNGLNHEGGRVPLTKKNTHQGTKRGRTLDAVYAGALWTTGYPWPGCPDYWTALSVLGRKNG